MLHVIDKDKLKVEDMDNANTSGTCTVVWTCLLQLRVGGGPSSQAGDAQPGADHQVQRLVCTQLWRWHRQGGEVGSFSLCRLFLPVRPVCQCAWKMKWPYPCYVSLKSWGKKERKKSFSEMLYILILVEYWMLYRNLYRCYKNIFKNMKLIL